MLLLTHNVQQKTVYVGRRLPESVTRPTFAGSCGGGYVQSGLCPELPRVIALGLAEGRCARIIPLLDPRRRDGLRQSPARSCVGVKA